MSITVKIQSGTGILRNLDVILNGKKVKSIYRNEDKEDETLVDVDLNESGANKLQVKNSIFYKSNKIQVEDGDIVEIKPDTSWKVRLLYPILPFIFFFVIASAETTNKSFNILASGVLCCYLVFMLIIQINLKIEKVKRSEF